MEILLKGLEPSSNETHDIWLNILQYVSLII